MHSRKTYYLQALIVSMLGALIVCAIVILFPAVASGNSIFSGVAGGPWIEEGLKYLFVLVLMSQIVLNIKAIPFIGVGFATAEAIRHIEMTGYASPRAFLAHLVFGLVMALFFYLVTRMKTTDMRGVMYALALLIPVALHLTYNLYLCGDLHILTI